MNLCQAVITNIVDGDTMDIVARPWPGQKHEGRVRLTCRGQAAVDAWEMRGRERRLGEIATAFVRQELQGCEWVVVSIGDKRDVFGRLLASIFYIPGCDDMWTVLSSGMDLGARLIDKGHATAYVRSMIDGPIMPVPADW